jgi:hypothetical protein
MPITNKSKFEIPICHLEQFCFQAAFAKIIGAESLVIARDIRYLEIQPFKFSVNVYRAEIHGRCSGAR